VQVVVEHQEQHGHLLIDSGVHLEAVHQERPVTAEHDGSGAVRGTQLCADARGEAVSHAAHAEGDRGRRARWHVAEVDGRRRAVARVEHDVPVVGRNGWIAAITLLCTRNSAGTGLPGIGGASRGRYRRSR